MIENLEPPVARLLRNNGTPEWQQINSLFHRFDLPAPSTRLRDELSTVLAWARYGEAVAAQDEIVRVALRAAREALNDGGEFNNLGADSALRMIDAALSTPSASERK